MKLWVRRGWKSGPCGTPKQTHLRRKKKRSRLIFLRLILKYALKLILNILPLSLPLNTPLPLCPLPYASPSLHSAHPHYTTPHPPTSHYSSLATPHFPPYITLPLHTPHLPPQSTSSHFLLAPPSFTLTQYTHSHV